MNNLSKKKYFLIGLLFCFVISLITGILIMTKTGSGLAAFADTASTKNSDNFVVLSDTENVAATFGYARLNDTECSVRITNKTEATKALIPSTTVIDGKTYKVTEVAANGFTSSTKLIRVSLPVTIKKIGNMAFANCTSLEHISLANVEEIGNNVFYKCTSLAELVIPMSVEKIGTYLLRNNTTQVYVRAASEGAGWASTWNYNNNNQEVIFSSDFEEPLVLEPIYDTTTYTRSSTIIGYMLSGGQPRTDSFYFDNKVGNDDPNDDALTENIGSDVFLPAQYEGKDIVAIDESAFDGNGFNQLIIEYSSIVLKIRSNAFMCAQGKNVTINRPIAYCNADKTASDNIFSLSEIQSIVLPDTVSGIADQMFYGCPNLANIYFIEPTDIQDREAVLNIYNELAAQSEQGVVHLTQNSSFNTIGESAFGATTAIKELHIYDNVKTVGATINSDWGDDQVVYVHNDNHSFTAKNGYAWHQDWNCFENLDNVKYSAEYYTITLNANGGYFEYNGINETEIEIEVKLNETMDKLPTQVYLDDDHVFVAWKDKDGNPYYADTVYTQKADLELMADWDQYTYKIKYDFNKPESASYPEVTEMDDSEIYRNAGSTLSENKFAIRGWRFIGWQDKNGESFEDKQIVYTFNAEHNSTVVLYAKWEIIPYCITYKYEKDKVENLYADKTTYTVEETVEFETYNSNGYRVLWSPASIEKGSIGAQVVVGTANSIDFAITYELCNYAVNNIANPDTYNSEKQIVLKDPTKIGYEFKGWQLDGQYITNLDGVSGNITLTAVWSSYNGTVKSIKASDKEITVRDSIVTLNLPNTSFNSECHIIVASTVQQLIIHSDVNISYNMYITVEGDIFSLDLQLENFTLRAPQNTVAISMNSVSFLNLYAYDSVIYGGDGSSTFYESDNGSNGKCAIECNAILINTAVTIYGGNGGHGGHGADYRYYDTPNYTGATCGGDGGDGAYAISSKQITIQHSNVTLKGGDGGYGGNGGMGRTAATSAHGGSGGTAGMGAMLKYCKIADGCTNVYVLKGMDGADGEFGKGGPIMAGPVI